MPTTELCEHGNTNPRNPCFECLPDIDDRTVSDVAAEAYKAIWDLLEGCYELDGETAGRIAQTASDLTELALIRECHRDVSR